MTNNNSNNYINELKIKLDSVLLKESKKSFFKGLLAFIISTGVLFFLLVLSELAGNFTSEVRTVLFWSFVLITILLAVYFLVLPISKSIFVKKKNYVEAANKVGEVFPEVKDDLANILQLTEDNESYYSNSLINAALSNIYKRTKNIDFKKVVSLKILKKLLRTAIVTIFLIALFFLLIPSLQASANRLINFQKEFIEPPEFSFIVEPGNAKLAKGENLQIVVKTIGKHPKQIYFKKKSIEETEYNSTAIKADSGRNFIITIRNIKNSFQYFISSKDITSNTFKVVVLNRPVINSFSVEIIPPSYSRLPKEILEDNGNIIGLPGTKVKYKISATKKLSKAKIIFKTKKTVAFALEGNIGKTDFRIYKNDEYHFNLTDEEGTANENPITYTIKTLEDNFPNIELISPDKNVKLPQNDKLTLLSKISDDYGISKLILNYRLSQSRYESIAKSFTKVDIPVIRGEKEDDVYYLWNLSNLNLAANDVISYFLEVFDNDNINGPKSSKTLIHTVRIPSLDELLTETEDVHQKAEDDLMKTFKEAEKLKEDIQNINNDLKKNSKKINWDEKDKIEKAIDKFKQLGNKIDDIKSKMNKMKNEMQQNNLLSKETLKKYAELQKLLDQMSSEEMKKALEKLQASLQKMMRDQVQNSMNNFKMNEEMFQKSIERTLKLLKRIQVEQKVDELIKRTEKLAKEQEELKKETQKANQNNKENLDRLNKKQNDITKNLKNLEKAMKDLKEKMNEFKDMPQKEMEKMRENFEKQQNQKLSEQASKQMMAEQLQMSTQNQEQIKQNMQKMLKQIESLKSNLQRKSQMQVLSDMMKISNELISLSKQQEQLKNETTDLRSGSSQLNKKSEKQFELQNNLSKVLKQMSKLSQKTFAITPEMGRALGKARSEMSRSISSMQNRNSSLAVMSQNGAMASLNQAATLMNGAMQQMMQGGQGGGMMSLMQQMQQLSQQQMQLNQMTQMLNQGKLTMQQQAQMQRLAKQQALIQKSLAELNKEAKISGESKKITANLDQILQKMKEVVTNMNTQKVDDNLIHEQKHILSKLLDAQRSINERDFENKRISESGKIFKLKSPAELFLNNEDKKNIIQDELMKAINEGYTKDYENLIRKYYDALEKNKN
ncbi:hypothetical protein BMS3Abin04_01553 [bacterium BMS3Abin04]|nr:hypothetical protein BMS3Abin04_01553 [bacterium BMS3Abin04]